METAKLWALTLAVTTSYFALPSNVYTQKAWLSLRDNARELKYLHFSVSRDRDPQLQHLPGHSALHSRMSLGISPISLRSLGPLGADFYYAIYRITSRKINGDYAVPASDTV